MPNQSEDIAPRVMPDEYDDEREPSIVLDIDAMVTASTPVGVLTERPPLPDELRGMYYHG